MAKYKILEKGYPKFILSAELFDIVEEDVFFKEEPNRIPLLIGTQFGIYPYEFRDLKQFEGMRIAILGKSLLSGHQGKIKEFVVNENNRLSCLRNYRIIFK